MVTLESMMIFPIDMAKFSKVDLTYPKFQQVKEFTSLQIPRIWPK